MDRKRSSSASPHRDVETFPSSTSGVVSKNVSNVPTSLTSLQSGFDPDATRAYAERHGWRGPLNGTQFAVWGMRREVEVGVRAPRRVAHDELPEVVPGYVRNYWHGFIHLLECRWSEERYYGNAAPFTSGFAAVWCGIEKWEAVEARKRLVRLGLLVPSGKSGHLKLWLPKAAE
jgi:hypothetical protein